MTSTFNDYYFDDFAHPDDQIFTNFSVYLTAIIYYLTPFKLAISGVGFVLNTAHLIIVTRRPFRNNSIYTIMAGITVCDLFTMFVILKDLYLDRNGFFGKAECWLPFSYLGLITHFILHTIQDCFRRLSTWLALLMALIRLLIVKNPLNASFSFLSTRSFALSLILVLLLVSSIIDFLTAIQYEFLDNGPYWIQHCPSFPRNYSVPYNWVVRESHITDDFRPLAVKYNLMSNGASKIVPAVTLPILSILLIRIMKNAAESRKRLANGSKDSEFEKSIRMVALMTIFSMFAEGIIGTVSAITTFYYDYYHIFESNGLLDEILINLAVLNAIVHCIICYTVNSQYQLEARKTFLWWRKNQVDVMQHQMYRKSSTKAHINASHTMIE